MPRRSRSRPRRSRSRPRRSRSRPRNRIEVSFPYNRRNITVYIPSPEICTRNYRKRSFYCGNKNRLPRQYSRYGTTFECLKKGFGAGSCSIYRYN